MSMGRAPRVHVEWSMEDKHNNDVSPQYNQRKWPLRITFLERLDPEPLVRPTLPDAML